MAIIFFICYVYINSACQNPQGALMTGDTRTDDAEAVRINREKDSAPEARDIWTLEMNAELARRGSVADMANDPQDLQDRFIIKKNIFNNLTILQYAKTDISVITPLVLSCAALYLILLLFYFAGKRRKSRRDRC